MKHGVELVLEAAWLIPTILPKMAESKPCIFPCMELIYNQYGYHGLEGQDTVILIIELEPGNIGVLA